MAELYTAGMSGIAYYQASSTHLIFSGTKAHEAAMLKQKH